MIKWVFFDLAGVLFVEDYPQMMRILGKSMGLPADYVWEGYYHNLKERLCLWNQGRCSALEFWKPFFRLRKDASLSMKKKWVQETIDPFIPIPGTVKVLKQLKQVKLGIISNQPRKVIRHMNKQKAIMNAFDIKLVSCYLGLIKRFGDPRIFKLALKRAKTKPEECIYIDDRAVHVETAQSLGTKGIVFESPQQLKKELRALGVKF